MSGSPYLWVVIGEASRLPVFAADNKMVLHRFLTTRRVRETTMLRVFRWGGPKGMIEVCVRCFINAPNQPVEQRGHS